MPGSDAAMMRVWWQGQLVAQLQRFPTIRKRYMANERVRAALAGLDPAMLGRLVGEACMTANIEGLRAYQARQRQKTIDAIESAKRAIEAELDKHGYYPQNGGRLSKQEVLRRAGVSGQTCKNPAHKETSAALDRWIKRIKKNAPTIPSQAKDAKAQRIAELEERLSLLARHYDRFKMEYNELLHQVETLERENAGLKRQLGQVWGDSSKVIFLDDRR